MPQVADEVADEVAESGGAIGMRFSDGRAAAFRHGRGARRIMGPAARRRATVGHKERRCGVVQSGEGQ